MIVPFPSHRAGTVNIAGTIDMARREAKFGFVARARTAPRILQPRLIAPLETVRDLNKEANEWLDEIGAKFKPFNPTVEKARAKRKAKLEVDDAWETLIQSVITKIPISEEEMMTRPQIMKTTRIGEKDKKNYLAFVLFAEIAERPDIITAHKDGKPHYYRKA